MLELPADCVARVRAGDMVAFEALFRAVHHPLLAFGAQYTGDVARAEELVQDLFFELWRSRATWTVTGSVSAYLYAALRNRALNVRRRDSVEQRWAESAAMEPEVARHAFQSSSDEQVESTERLAALADALHRLPERCGLMMQMRWHGGMSYSEIADVMGISVKGVENQLARGLKALRAEFSAD